MENDIAPSTADANSPSLFINTIPKSGSVFIENALQEICSRKHLILGTGYFPNDTILLAEARRFSEGGFSAQQHFNCAPNNVAILEKYVGRWVVHLRDPRSVTLSWTHHINKFIKLNQTHMLDYVSPIPGPDYVSSSFSDQLNWHIDNFLPFVVTWTQRWLEYADSNRNRVMVTTYEEMSEDQPAFFSRLCKFYEVPHNTIGDLSRFRTEAHHFRTGTTDEWRQVFSAEQKDRALNAILPALQSRMGWSET